MERGLIKIKCAGLCLLQAASLNPASALACRGFQGRGGEFKAREPEEQPLMGTMCRESLCPCFQTPLVGPFLPATNLRDWLRDSIIYHLRRRQIKVEWILKAKPLGTERGEEQKTGKAPLGPLASHFLG